MSVKSVRILCEASKRMARRTSSVSRMALFVCWVLVSGCAAAQLIDTKDLTDSRAVVTPTPSQSTTTDKDCFIDHSDGRIIRDIPEKLRLEIVSAELQRIDETTQITAHIQLKNEGSHAVLLPWQTAAVGPRRTAADEEVKYEAAIVGLKLGTQEYRSHGTRLRGEAELRADPNSYVQHVELLPGQWVDLKYTALVECQYDLADPPLCSPFRTDEHARLTAFWHEWLITEQGDGCAAKSSADKSRMIDSPPLEIDYVSAEVSAASNESRPR